MVLLFQEENQETLCEELLKKWEQFFGEKTKSEDKSSGELKYTAQQKFSTDFNIISRFD